MVFLGPRNAWWERDGAGCEIMDRGVSSWFRRVSNVNQSPDTSRALRRRGTRRRKAEKTRWAMSRGGMMMMSGGGGLGRVELRGCQ